MLKDTHAQLRAQDARIEELSRARTVDVDFICGMLDRLHATEMGGDARDAEVARLTNRVELLQVENATMAALVDTPYFGTFRSFRVNNADCIVLRGALLTALQPIAAEVSMEHVGVNMTCTHIRDGSIIVEVFVSATYDPDADTQPSRARITAAMTAAFEPFQHGFLMPCVVRPIHARTNAERIYFMNALGRHDGKIWTLHAQRCDNPECPNDVGHWKRSSRPAYSERAVEIIARQWEFSRGTQHGFACYDGYLVLEYQVLT